MTKFSKTTFLRACGGQSPLKILLENRESGSQNTFVFEQPFILIGQHAAADIRLKHPAIGTRHIYLQLLDGRLFCLQLSNRSPLQWGGNPKSWGWIDRHDRIQFGPFTLSVLDGLGASRLDDQTHPNPLVSSPNCISPVYLEHRSEAGQPFRGQVNRALSLLGSSSACKFRIQSARVSSIHCGLVRTTNGIWAVDLGGNGGICVNNVGSRVACLEEGDLFELGGVGFHIHYETPPPASELSEVVPQDESAQVQLPSESAPAKKEEPLAIVEKERPAVSSMVLAEPAALATTNDREAFERMIGPVLEHFAAFQNQTFQQFQDLLNNMIHVMGSMFRDQLDSVREEMRRFDHISDELANLQKEITAFPDAIPVDVGEAVAATKEKIAAPEPRTERTANMADPNMHLWLQSRIAELNEQRTTLWSRLMSLVRGKSDPT